MRLAWHRKVSNALYRALKTVNLHHVNFTSVRKQNTERWAQILLMCLNSLPHTGAAEKMDQKDTPAITAGGGKLSISPRGFQTVGCIGTPTAGACPNTYSGHHADPESASCASSGAGPVHTRLDTLTYPPSALPSTHLSVRQMSCQSASQLPHVSGSALLPGHIPSHLPWALLELSKLPSLLGLTLIPVSGVSVAGCWPSFLRPSSPEARLLT